MDTRTAPRPSGGRPQAIEEPVIGSQKVPSDPAQVIVNHASFRVRLAQPPHSAGRPVSLADETAPLPIVPSSVRSSSGEYAPIGAGASGAPGAPQVPRPTRARRAAPVMWSGRAAPEDAAATQLLQAVQAGGTRLVPRIGRDDGSAFEDLDLVEDPSAGRPGSRRRPSVIGPRSPVGGPVVGADLPGRPFAATETATETATDTGTDYEREPEHDRRFEVRPGARVSHRSRAADRRAYHPGRGRGHGLVLLPLRVFLGGISVYAGMSKLCDPVFFDGGERGSMVQWLSSLEPWAAAAPLHDLALGHPVGAGLTVAFVQIIVGMLTGLGLWQRFAAGLGMLLSVALLLTVSWRSAPAYDVPDIIYLAAWSPLLIAGAPAYSLDGRLANEAWRRLGPRSSLFDLRRWVLRRGVVIATVVVGLTLIVGSVLGGAVRAGSFRTDVPNPSEPPTNHLPGEPLPSRSDEPDRQGRSEGPESRSPSAAPSTPEERRTTPAVPQPTQGGAVGGGTGDQPGQGGTGTTPGQPQQPPPPPSQPQQPEPTPTGDGALGGILGAGAGGLLGMSGGGSAGGYTSA